MNQNAIEENAFESCLGLSVGTNEAPQASVIIERKYNRDPFYTDDLILDCSANALALLQSCTKPSI